MWGLELATFNREALIHNKAAEPLVRSYLGMRMAIGLIGVALPIALVFVDQVFLNNHRLRGSMSAYYHSPARDLFVAGLTSTGLFLITYMSAKRRTYDYVLSLLGGILVIIVAFFPTARDGADFPAGTQYATTATSCADFPGPPTCSATQAWLGEYATQMVHRTSAILFVALLGVLCCIWAARETILGPHHHHTSIKPDAVFPPRSLAEALRHPIRFLRYMWSGRVRQPDGTDIRFKPPRRRALGYLAAAVAIGVSGLWSVVGVPIPLPWFGTIGSTYVSEFGCFEAFGIAWIIASWDLMPHIVKATGRGLSRVVDRVTDSSAE